MRVLTRYLAICILGFYPKLLDAQTSPNAGADGVSLSLEQAVDFALGNSPLILQSQIDEEIGDRQIKSQLAGWLPQISANLGLTNNLKLQTQPIGGELITFGQPFNSNALIQVNQTLFNRDQLFASKGAEFVRTELNQTTTNAKINTVVLVSKAYFDILLTFEQLKIIDENLVRQEKQYKDARSRFDVGLVDKTDYQRATITLANLKSDRKRVETSLNAKFAYLKELMGYPLETTLELDYDYERMEQEAQMDTSQMLVLDNRIEYKLAQTQLAVTSLQTQYEKWSFIPNLSGFYNYNWLYFNQTIENLYNQSFPTSALGLTMAIPIFQGGRRNQQIKMARLREDRAEIGISNLEKQLNTEYESAMANYTASYFEWETLRENMELAEEVYNTIKLQYDEGVKAYVDLIVAETELRTSQLNNYNALYNVLASKLDLQQALGQIQPN